MGAWSPASAHESTTRHKTSEHTCPTYPARHAHVSTAPPPDSAQREAHLPTDQLGTSAPFIIMDPDLPPVAPHGGAGAKRRQVTIMNNTDCSRTRRVGGDPMEADRPLDGCLQTFFLTDKTTHALSGRPA